MSTVRPAFSDAGRNGATDPASLRVVVASSVAILCLAAILLALALRPWKLRLTPALWRNLIAYGAMLGLMNLLIYRSFETIPLGIAISIEVLGPLGVALLASRRPLGAVSASV